MSKTGNRSSARRPTTTRPHVVVVGGGFAGLRAVQALRRSPVDVTLIDRRNHHLFQPLLYEVATAALDPSSIAMPLRRIFRRQRNARVLLGEIKTVNLDHSQVETDEVTLDYDYLVLATGSTYHYFGHDHWGATAPGLKSLEDAISIRRRFLLTFEQAEQCSDENKRARLMTSVIVGGGPTGIELAGTMAEVARRVLRDDFRSLDTSSLRIVLAEGGERLLAAYPAVLSARAQRDLEELGVEVLVNTKVTDITSTYVALDDGTVVPAGSVAWAAGVRGLPPARGLEPFVRRDGRIKVDPDLSLPGHPCVFVVGDLAWVPWQGHEQPVPALAPAAGQMGEYVGRRIEGQVRWGASPDPFRYVDKGSLATIGRGRAVAAFGRFRVSGPTAWILWVVVHIFFLVGFRNKLFVLLDWAFAYLTFQRGSRLITGEAESASASLEPLLEGEKP